MRIHHLNCISTSPLGGRLTDGRTASIVQRGESACHCLRIERNNTRHVFCGHSARLPIDKMTRPTPAP